VGVTSALLMLVGRDGLFDGGAEEDDRMATEEAVSRAPAEDDDGACDQDDQPNALSIQTGPSENGNETGSDRSRVDPRVSAIVGVEAHRGR
jgi:hypothetical protein